MNNVITETLVKVGYEQNLIKLVDTDEGVMCRIGEYHFFFGGETAEELTAREYQQQVPTEDIINEIYTTLESFRECEDFEDEYNYYFYYLMEYVTNPNDN